jgi:putative ABC transport system permease protein
MIQNYISTAFRTLRRERFFTVLNLLGLATAFCCAAYVALWVWDEWQRDRFFPNSDRLVRVVTRLTTEKEAFDQAVTSVQVGPNMQKDYAEVASYCRMDMNESVIKVDNQQFSQEGILTVDSTFLDIFNYELKSGNPATALTEPYTVVLTEKLAQKLFGNKDPYNQTIQMDLYDREGNGQLYRVTGVLKDEPRPSHVEFDMLVSFSSFFKYRPNYFGEEGWYESSYYTYLLLRPDASRSGLQVKMPDFFKKYLDPLWKGRIKCDFELQPLRDIYLTSKRRYEIGENGNASNVYIFGIVGILILLVAGINYVNLSTARIAKRVQNMGVRKALGAQRSQLAGQILVESVLTTSIAAAISMVLIQVAQPVFGQMTGKTLTFFDMPALKWGLLGTALVLGILAGFYPAFVLSGQQPVMAMKGNVHTPKSTGDRLRQSLVTLQFSVSIILIISVLVIRGQMNYIQNKNLGFDKDAVLALFNHGNASVVNGFEAFRNDLMMNAPDLVEGVAVSNLLPVAGTGNSSATSVDNSGKRFETSICRMRMDTAYASVMKLQFLAGRNFSAQFPADFPTDTTQNYILNAAAVRAFGWETPENAIGKPFKTHGKSGQVVGIVQDFHYNTLKHKIEPICVHLVRNNFSQILLRLKNVNTQNSIATIENIWKKHFPDALFSYTFLDEALAKEYRSEARFGKVFSAFSMFSIFIACLGLFGLAASAAERRTKEIGVRKVLGASVASITGLLAKDFLKLVLIAIVIASPIAYYFMNQWLSDFAYRIDIQWWMFALAGGLAVVIAFLTVGFQSVKAALANPVKSLRSE